MRERKKYGQIQWWREVWSCLRKCLSQILKYSCLVFPIILSSVVQSLFHCFQTIWAVHFSLKIWTIFVHISPSRNTDSGSEILTAHSPFSVLNVDRPATLVLTISIYEVCRCQKQLRSRVSRWSDRAWSLWIRY